MKAPPAGLLERLHRTHEAVGPLRFQMASADCVPTTVVNALLCVTRRPVPHRLMRLIWASSLDQDGGTGWVCSRLLVELLESWFRMAGRDGEGDALSGFSSRLCLGAEASLEGSDALLDALNAGGAVCLTTERGKHYTLLHGHDGGQTFYGFDPTWPGVQASQKATDLLEATRGMANIQWSKAGLARVLADRRNQFVHLIRPSAPAGRSAAPPRRRAPAKP